MLGMLASYRVIRSMDEVEEIWRNHQDGILARTFDRKIGLRLALEAGRPVYFTPQFPLHKVTTEPVRSQQPRLNMLNRIYQLCDLPPISNISAFEREKIHISDAQLESSLWAIQVEYDSAMRMYRARDGTNRTRIASEQLRLTHLPAFITVRQKKSYKYKKPQITIANEHTKNTII